MISGEAQNPEPTRGAEQCPVDQPVGSVVAGLLRDSECLEQHNETKNHGHFVQSVLSC